MNVSILVVLDCGSRRAGIPGKPKLAYSFNPCCIGLWVATKLRPTSEVSDVGFNPCCIGLWVATKPAGKAERRKPRFQSLLYWIVGRDNPDFVVPLQRFDVSILVVLDCGSRPPVCGRKIPASLAFQSLLYWIVGRDEAATHIRGIGCGFQSLLYWIVGRDRIRAG